MFNKNSPNIKNTVPTIPLEPDQLVEASHCTQRNHVSRGLLRAGHWRLLFWSLSFSALFWLTDPSTVQAQIVIEGTPRWGVDGNARAEQFNLLTIDLMNNSDRPWTGNLLLEAVTGIQSAGIPTLQPGMFLEPYGRRRIQFVVFLPTSTEYRLTWGSGNKDSYLIDEPSIVRGPATVQLIADDTTSSGAQGVARFPDADFPSSAGGLDGLGTVLLDHVPRWTEPQQQAFRDWLCAGGTVHLYHEAPGQFPVFRKNLVELNQPSDRFPVASGQVVRHAATLRQAVNDFRPDSTEKTSRYQQWQTSQSLYSILRTMTTPHHNWTLIYLLAVVYLLLLFPGCWLLGRQRGDYRLTYAAILGLVCVFSVGFHTIGSRGYGEQTSINSVAIAKPGADGRAVVTQWSNLFVTRGGEYLIRHNEEGLVYSTGQLNEPVSGRALNRPQGAMVTDIPSFSARSIVHTGVLPGQGVQIELKAVETTSEQLQKLQVQIERGAELWTDDPFFMGLALWGGRIHSLSPSPDNLLIAQSGARNLSEFIDPNVWNVSRHRWQTETLSQQQLYQRTVGPLLAHDLTIYSPDDLESFSQPDGELRIYLFTRMPPDFFATGDISLQQAGRVLHISKMMIP